MISLLSRRSKKSKAPEPAREAALLAAVEQVARQTRMSRAELRVFQTHRLRALVEHAYEEIPFYRRKYTAAGFHPSHVRSLADLERIPLVTKDELRRAHASELRPMRSVATARRLASSGSTGVPLAILRDEASLWHFTAYNMLLYYQWCLGRPIAEVLYFVDFDPQSIDYALVDLLRTTVGEERFIPVARPVEAFVEALDTFHPRFVSSYPSSLRNVAIALDRRGRRNEQLELLHLTSEMLDSNTRTLLAKVFPRARLVETYTSTEAGLLAHGCPASGHWHVAEENVLCEIVAADGQACDEVGEIVVTDLTNWTMPMIRYRGLGDLCRWDQTPCACGTTRRSLRQLEGRRSDSLLAADGSLLSPYVVIDAMDDVRGIYQYQVIQQRSGYFTVLVVRDATSPLSAADVRWQIDEAIGRAVGRMAGCRVEFVLQIPPRSGRHKTPLVCAAWRGRA